MKTLQIFFLLFLTICLSGCYQRFYYELKTDHLLVSAVDGRSYSKLSIIGIIGVIGVIGNWCHSMYVFYRQ